jgi:phosphoribosylamine--glycine ligase
VVLASGGYPGKYEKGKLISGLEDVKGMDGVMVFHAGTAFTDGSLTTSGGRVLGVTATGADIMQARDRAYEAVGKIRFDGMHYRTDIAERAIKAFLPVKGGF